MLDCSVCTLVCISGCISASVDVDYSKILKHFEDNGLVSQRLKRHINNERTNLAGNPLQSVQSSHHHTCVLAKAFHNAFLFLPNRECCYCYSDSERVLQVWASLAVRSPPPPVTLSNVAPCIRLLSMFSPSSQT